MKGTSGLVGLLAVLFLAGMSGLRISWRHLLSAPVIDQGLCAHDTTANLASIIDQKNSPTCAVDDCAERFPSMLFVKPSCKFNLMKKETVLE